MMDQQIRRHADAAILRTDLDHGAGSRSRKRQQIEEMAVFLELGKPAEPDLIEWEDHACGLQLLPASNQLFLRDFGLAIDDVFRSTGEFDKLALDGSKQRHRAQARLRGVAQLPRESGAWSGD